MKQYIPVEVIKKEIEFLNSLMKTVGQNDGIESIVKILGIVNSPDNRIDERDIYRAVQLEYFEQDARDFFDMMYSPTYNEENFDFSWLAEQHDPQFTVAEFDQWQQEFNSYIADHDIKKFYEEA